MPKIYGTPNQKINWLSVHAEAENMLQFHKDERSHDFKFDPQISFTAF